MGPCGLPAAREFKGKVEALLSCVITATPPDTMLSTWLAELPDKMHAKLAKAGLVQSRAPVPAALTLDEWLTKYISQREGDLKPASIAELRRTGKLLKAHFGEDTTLDRITRNGAADWRSVLADRGLAEATIRKHCRNAKTVFSEAAERDLIEKNPFAKLTSSPIAADRGRYVTPDETTVILAACPDVQWRTLVGLARLAGLRCPSETHILTWADVDWERGRLSVYSPKTERFEKRRRRTVPIVPELAAILQDAFAAAADGQERVLTLSRHNPQQRLHGIVKRAEVEPIERCFQTLRQSRETEWAGCFPGHAVATWMGHSEKVSREHYLMVTDDLFDLAAGQGAAECAAVTSRIDSHGLANAQPGEKPEARETPSFAGSRREKQHFDEEHPCGVARDMLSDCHRDFDPGALERTGAWYPRAPGIRCAGITGSGWPTPGPCR